ncbi:MAG: IPT/TIG domain-containing protein [Bryobacterales bacterium]|nr:IPT/TIG domain-containing protein [Bryobacterales bacterium]
MIIRLSSTVALLLALQLLVPTAAAPAATSLMVKAPSVKLETVASSMPVWFEPNRGQVSGRTEWTARAAGAWLFLTSNEVVYALPPDTSGFDPTKTRGVPNFKTTNVHMRMVGGCRVKGAGEGALGSYSNYFVGKHEDDWFTGVPHFERVRYAEVYPGIDMVYYATGKSVEYDFILEPGADPSTIELAFDGVAGVNVDDAGDIIVSAGEKSFRQHRPRVYQGPVEIEASYRLTERGTVKVDVGEFDPLVSLRVDPVLDFATYLGGPGEDGLWNIAVASDGNPILLGSTQSPASPSLDPFQQPSIVSLAPIVMKMSADGQRIHFYSILGRGGWDSGVALALDREDRIVVGGTTRSANFPLRNAFQTEFKAIWDNGFVARLSKDGRTLVHSSYLGGSNSESISSATTDDSGNAYVVGGSLSHDYPIIQAIQPKSGGGNDGVISKVGLDGRLLMSTFMGGPGLDVLRKVLWREDGVLYTGGISIYDGFPLKDPIFSKPTSRQGFPNAVFVAIDTVANTIRLSTYLADGASAEMNGIDVDTSGSIYLVGYAVDRQFPLKNPLFSELVQGSGNGFLVQLQPDGTGILFSTLLPGFIPSSVSVDSRGFINLGGTSYAGFAAKDSLYEFKGGGIKNSDHAVMKLGPNGRSLVYATPIGGTGNEIGVGVATGRDDTLFFAGQTGSINYPTRSAYQPNSGGSTDGVFGRITDNSVTQLPMFQVTPPSLTLRYVVGDPLPAPLRLSVSGLTQSVAIQSAVNWLRVSPASLNASGSVQISPDLGSLAPGIHRGTVRIETVAVDISVTVLAAPPLLTNVEPAIVAAGSGDTEITLRGSGFTAQTVLYVEGTLWLVSPVRFVNGSTILFTMPKTHLSGEYNFALTVQNPNSAVSKAISLPVGRPAPAIVSGGIVSAASFAGQVISPGEIVTIFGENFEPGMKVVFDGIPAEPFYLSAKQLSVTVPYGIVGLRELSVVVQQSPDRKSVPERIVVWPSRPGLFTANSNGKGQGAILNQDGSVNSVTNPAARGTVVVLYGTGGGTLAGNLLELPLKVFIDGIDCEVLYAGVAPGLIPGVVQVNVRVPELAVNGEVVLRVGERESQEGVTVSLR